MTAMPQIEAPAAPDGERRRPRGLAGLYAPQPDRFDEALDQAGGLRPGWERLAQTPELADPQILGQRADELRRLVLDLGVTYNVYGDPRGAERAWPIDVVPLPISVAEWRTIEAGVLQRAWTLERALEDLYGARGLIASGALPAEAAFANPGFQRACAGIQPRGGRWLQLYAADLARAPDGSWTVIADRCQSPSGLGYALESRALMARVLPEPIRAARVRRLDGFVDRLREGLEAMAGSDDPSIVLLTPGPLNETYFEHVSIARRLGITLVMGDDLAVRDDRVYLKTLGGLRRVDVVLRRLDDAWCDPLALRGDSTLGVPGLVEAARARKVAIANAIGAAAAEGPRMMAALPGLCRALLDETPHLPTLETIPFDDPAAPAALAAEPEGWVARAAWSASGEVMPLHRLDAAGREAALARIARRPARWCLQRRVVQSTAPVWVGGKLEPRALVIRVFAACGPDGAFAVMPGGLARTAHDPEAPALTMQQGGGAKDVWLLATGIGDIMRVDRRARPSLRLRRDVDDLPSRVADHLFWLGRYLERVDGGLRLGRGLLARTAQSADAARAEPAAPTSPFADLIAGYGLPEATSLPAWIHSLAAFPFGGPASGLFDGTLRALSRVARNLIDRLPGETQMMINALAAAPPALPPRAPDALAAYDRRIAALAAFHGAVVESMARDRAWPFMEIGRRIERGLALLGLVGAAALRQAPDESVLSLLLEVGESAALYRRRYHAVVQLDAALDVMLADPSNPRSLVFQFDRLHNQVARLPRLTDDGLPTPLERAIERARGAARLADAVELAEADAAGGRPALARLSEALEADLRIISDCLTRDYFRVETLTAERATR